MMVSLIKIFSFYVNCSYCLKKDNMNSLRSIVNVNQMNKQHTFIKNKCNRIFSNINCNNFSFKDYKMYIFHKFVFNNKMNWKDIDEREIPKIANKYTTEQFNEDKAFVLKLQDKLNFKNIGELYNINSNGNNILVDLIIDGKISPLFYIMMYRKGIRYYTNPKYKISKTTEKINKLTNSILN